MNIEQLSDSELALMLKERGVSVGPIVETTRRVYERKLQRLLEGGVSGDGFAASQGTEQEEYEEEDIDANADTQPIEEPTYRQTRSSPVRPQRSDPPARRTSPIRPQPSSSPARRASPQRPQARYERGDVSESRRYDSYESSDVSLTRRSLRPTSTTVTSRSAIRPTTTDKPKSSSKRGMSVWLQLLILVAVGVIIFLVIQNMEPAAKDPMKSLG